MHLDWLEIMRATLAVGAGVAIGLGFGRLQQAARARNERRQREGQLRNAWGLMPGSGGRVAMLLMTLVVIQVVCPMLFAGDTAWFVSAGLLGGYGWMLARRVRDLRRELRHAP